jgi:hypothetical protein
MKISAVGAVDASAMGPSPHGRNAAQLKASSGPAAKP